MQGDHNILIYFILFIILFILHLPQNFKHSTVTNFCEFRVNGGLLKLTFLVQLLKILTHLLRNFKNSVSFSHIAQTKEVQAENAQNFSFNIYTLLKRNCSNYLGLISQNLWFQINNVWKLVMVL